MTQRLSDQNGGPSVEEAFHLRVVRDWSCKLLAHLYCEIVG